jgi:predicted enzyme related to lactoylglutathione lyase
MHVSEPYAPGTFCWVELATTDAAAAGAFYSGLFGWTVVEVPMGEGQIYYMLQLGGRDVAALYEQQPEQRALGVPPSWLSYVAVTDVEESAARVADLGGKLLMDAFDVMDVGRMALAQDPGGAAFALWQAKSHIGGRVVGEPGAMCWHELATHHPGVVCEFYQGLLGWSSRKQPVGPVAYYSFQRGDEPAAGMLQMAGEWEGIPSHWMVYFAVADCDAAAARAGELGGAVKVPPTDVPGVGRFAVIQDPQGAVFSIIRLEPS